MDTNQIIKDFITDWFQRFDRLDPVEAFLPNLAPNVDWNAPDSDLSLTGHDRFKAWYDDILETFERPTTHDVSNVVIGDGVAEFDVKLGARTKAGESVALTAREVWRFQQSEAGQPLITQYDVSIKE